MNPQKKCDWPHNTHNLLQCLFIVLGELDPLPHLGRLVGPLDSLHVQIHLSCTAGEGGREGGVVRKDHHHGVRNGPRDLPSCSLTVAYLLLARGHACFEHSPVTLNSFRQKVCVFVLRNCDHVTHRDTTALFLLCLEGAESILYDTPDNLRRSHV